MGDIPVIDTEAVILRSQVAQLQGDVRELERANRDLRLKNAKLEAAIKSVGTRKTDR